MPPSSPAPLPTTGHRILVVDSLRGFLAWTVVLFHCWGVLGKDHWFFHKILNGGQAVNCFFIVSGFSIVSSVLSDGDSFSVKSFFIRRWWRIYPVYVLSLAAMYFGGMALGGCAPAGWGLDLGGHQLENAGWHWLLHLFMLHGTIPYDILPSNASAILSAAWSLAHEEQFYLCMPLPMLLFARKKWLWHGAAMVALFALMWQLRRSHLFGLAYADWWTDQRFWFGYYEYFLLGICCAFVIHPSVGPRWKLGYGAAIALTLLQIWRLRGVDAPTVVWLAVFALVCLKTHDKNNIGKWLWAATEHRVLVWLGRCSYSTYLFHWFFLLLAACLYNQLPLNFGKTGQLCWMVLLGGGMTLAASSASYWWAERKLMAFGRQLTTPPTALKPA